MVPAKIEKDDRRRMGDVTALEERIAHLGRTVDELSDVVARQASDIDRLTRRVTLLLTREAERDAAGVGPTLEGERPPHW